MQLNIKNVGKIKEAAIRVDGITVIAGENNTGKSTIGKLLFSIFNSMNRMDKKIEREKRNEIYRVISHLLQNKAMQEGLSQTEFRRRYIFWSKDFAEEVIELIYVNDVKNTAVELLRAYLEKFLMNAVTFENEEERTDFIDECMLKLKSIIDISDKKVMTEVITRWFNKVFEQQMSPLFEESIESEIGLLINNKKLNYKFKDNRCIDWDSEMGIIHEAFYVDNPFVLDCLSGRHFAGGLRTMDEHLLKKLSKKEENIYDGILDAVIAKDKLDDIYAILNEIVGGDIIENSDGEYCLKSKNFNKPLNIKNLSAGLKSFALIQQLLENGSLKEKDVLILDEPEIHLHPDWQLLYAKIIVLLQKKFDLTMVITTHSPYFLDAIDVFSVQYEMADKVNYYLAENEGEVSYMRDVTNNIDVIYKKLSDPMQELENIRNRLF